MAVQVGLQQGHISTVRYEHLLTPFPSLVPVWTWRRQPHFISEKWRFNTILSVWAIAITITHFTSPGSAEKCWGLEGFVNLALSKWRQFLSKCTNTFLVYASSFFKGPRLKYYSVVLGYYKWKGVKTLSLLIWEAVPQKSSLPLIWPR